MSRKTVQVNAQKMNKNGSAAKAVKKFNSIAEAAKWVMSKDASLQWKETSVRSNIQQASIGYDSHSDNRCTAYGYYWSRGDEYFE